jgi:hypothetical protein
MSDDGWQQVAGKAKRAANTNPEKAHSAATGSKGNKNALPPSAIPVSLGPLGNHKPKSQQQSIYTLYFLFLLFCSFAFWNR